MTSNTPFVSIDTHSPGNYLANQNANPFGVIFHDLPDRIDIYVADEVLQDAAFPAREQLPDHVKKLEGIFTQEGISATLREEFVPDAAFIYANPNAGGLARLYFSVRGEIEGEVMKVTIDPKRETA